ncbi:hypothetical protein N24_1796 [Corynebacterium suranareeae]|uniref:Uncharacterized protein n=2 Tax=Corynebacterium suranareeae TaxID=2506452 RepID=A0A169RY11_9CORY|nr:hypothetical protein N24_1796 [Corynebacterium suranareeae]
MLFSYFFSYYYRKNTTMSAFDELRTNYRHKFTDTWPAATVVRTGYSANPAFIIISADAMTQDTHADSNLITVKEHLNGLLPYSVQRKDRAFVSEIYTPIDLLEGDPELAQEILDVLDTLNNNAVFDDTHYSELELERLNEYVIDTLAYDMKSDMMRTLLKAQPGADLESMEELDIAAIQDWIDCNSSTVLEHNDGSVDDVPFDSLALARLYLQQRTGHSV